MHWDEQGPAREQPDHLVLVTGPTSEPVTLAEAKLHCRVDIDADDALITGLIAAARRTFEEINGRSLFTTTWKQILYRWPRSPWLPLRRPPLVSVTSVTYVDEAGTQRTWASGNYYTITGSTPGGILRKADYDWPTETLRAFAPIEITYVAGWPTVGAIPQIYKQALLLLVGHWYEHREIAITSGATAQELPMAFESLAMLDRVY